MFLKSRGEPEDTTTLGVAVQPQRLIAPEYLHVAEKPLQPPPTLTTAPTNHLMGTFKL